MRSPQISEGHYRRSQWRDNPLRSPSRETRRAAPRVALIPRHRFPQPPTANDPDPGEP